MNSTTETSHNINQSNNNNNNGVLRREDMVRVISHCMEGRFKPGETSRTCAAVLRSLLDYCDVFFGQAAQFHPLSVELPKNFHFIGEPSAFIIYDSEKFTAVEHLWSPQNRMEGEVKHAVCRLKSKTEPQLEFFVLSWFVRETYFNYSGAKKCCLLFRQLVQLVQLLGRETPVLVGGNFQLSPDEAEYLVGVEQMSSFSEVELFCLTYKPETIRKQLRSCGFFLCGNNFIDTTSENLVGTRSIKGNVMLNGCMDEFWRNPEDSFYWDPMTLDLSSDKIIETVSMCVSRMNNDPSTASPMSSMSYTESDVTSLRSEQQEGEEVEEDVLDGLQVCSSDNFKTFLASSKLQHLDLANFKTMEQANPQMKLSTQREKLKELKSFLECLELKMDAEKASAAFTDHTDGKSVNSQTVVLAKSDKVAAGVCCPDDVAMSLSTICEYDEHVSSSEESLGDEKWKDIFCGEYHAEEDAGYDDNQRSSINDYFNSDFFKAPLKSADHELREDGSLNETKINPNKSHFYKDIRIVEGATDDQAFGTDRFLDPEDFDTPAEIDQVTTGGSCSAM